MVNADSNYTIHGVDVGTLVVNGNENSSKVYYLVFFLQASMEKMMTNYFLPAFGTSKGTRVVIMNYHNEMGVQITH